MSKEDKVQNTTEELALAFLRRTVTAINAQLQIEVTRNGFKLEDVKKGKLKVVRTVVSAKNDDRFTCESFSIGKRLIMAVKWNPSGFVIERNSQTVANAVKVNPSFGISKNARPGLVLEATQREVEIEAGAQKYVSDLMKEKHLGKA